MIYSVRQATILDLLTFAPLAMQYAEEAAKHDNFPMDLEHMLMNAAYTIQDEAGCLLVCHANAEPVGFLWGHCRSLPWSKAKLAFDTVLFVRKDKRKTKAGYLIMKAWDKWAESAGAVEVQISIASGIHEEQTEGFFVKMGYKQVGTQFRKLIGGING